MENKNVEKLKTLSKGMLYDLKKILEIIEVVLLYNRPKPYIQDFFKMEHFDGIKEISVIKILKMLDTDFNIINFNRRQITHAVHIGLKKDEDATDFHNFYKLVDDLYIQPGTIKKITLCGRKASINDDYFHVLRIDGSKYWELIEELSNTRCAMKNDYKNAYDHLVSPKKFPFKDYKYSQIVQSNEGTIISNIELETITEQEFEKREKRL